MRKGNAVTVDEEAEVEPQGEFSPSQTAQIETMISAHIQGEAGDLYTLRYKYGIAGVRTGYIRASSLIKAEAVGRAFCNGLVGSRYITVEAAIIADESILGPNRAA